ncbi:MAG: transposase [Bacteriovoracaceae bacterium]|nr:transposase [Bacteriovoracaceae bacterium]
MSPLDNNLAEREFRAPVVGRKTWIGTHSKRCRNNGVLFSIVRSCMMNKINPRNYFPWIVNQIHAGKVLTL